MIFDKMLVREVIPVLASEGLYVIQVEALGSRDKSGIRIAPK